MMWSIKHNEGDVVTSVGGKYPAANLPVFVHSCPDGDITIATHDITTHDITTDLRAAICEWVHI